jgi:two-component system chemotaxis response regulator CheB
MINVLVVDDSPAVCMALRQLIDSEPGMRVIGTANDGIEAKRLAYSLSPDVITLDIDLPGINGLVLLDRLMKERATPVIIISGQLTNSFGFRQQALKLGAKCVLDKADLDFSRPKQTGTLLAQSILQAKQAGLTQPTQHRPAVFSTKRELVAIGASTGGTEAVRRIVCDLPEVFPPVIVTVHMPAGFTTSFAQRLDTIAKIKVKEAAQGETLDQGCVYIAPGNFHLKLKKQQTKFVCHIDGSEKVSGHRPSVDAMFQSVAEEVGRGAIGALLTGMGKDGAKGLLQMKQNGAYTIVQDEQSSVVYGMPREGAMLNAHCDQIALDAVAGRLISETGTAVNQAPVSRF